jgi:hypothetical protein
MKLKYKLCLVAVMLFILQSNGLGQCCAAGNPVNSNTLVPVSGANILGITYSHIYSLSDTYYIGDKITDREYIETEFNFSNLSFTYGLTDKLNIIADIGYFFNKTQNFVNDDYSRYAQGLGDLNIGFSFNSFQTDDREFSISQMIRMTLPVGVFNQIYDGIELPIDLQPSSGNYKYNLGIMLANRFGNSGFSLYSINSIEMAQFIETSTSEYKYGNLYNFALIGTYQILDELTSWLQVRCEIRDKALIATKSHPDVYSYLNATGLVNVFISPQLSYTIADSWTISSQFNYPIYINVNGEQLTNKYFIQGGISKSFNLTKTDDFSDSNSELPDINYSNLSFSTFKVSGNCGMCKTRIEKVVNQFKFVEASDWDPETEILTIYYKNESPDTTSILKSIADIGHDNEKFKADDAVYNKLHECCLYRKN